MLLRWGRLECRGLLRSTTGDLCDRDCRGLTDRPLRLLLIRLSRRAWLAWCRCMGLIRLLLLGLRLSWFAGCYERPGLFLVGRMLCLFLFHWWLHVLEFQFASINIESSKFCGNIRRHQLVISLGIINERVLLVVAGALVDIILKQSFVRAVLLLQPSGDCSDLLLLLVVIRKLVLVANMLLQQICIGYLDRARTQVDVEPNSCCCFHGWNKVNKSSMCF